MARPKAPIDRDAIVALKNELNLQSRLAIMNWNEMLELAGKSFNHPDARDFAEPMFRTFQGFLVSAGIVANILHPKKAPWIEETEFERMKAAGEYLRYTLNIKDGSRLMDRHLRNAVVHLESSVQTWIATKPISPLGLGTIGWVKEGTDDKSTNGVFRLLTLGTNSVTVRIGSDQPYELWGVQQELEKLTYKTATTLAGYRIGDGWRLGPASQRLGIGARLRFRLQEIKKRLTPRHIVRG